MIWLADGKSSSAAGNRLNNYPNPAIDFTVIPYNLPHGVQEGSISIYSTEGKEVQDYRVTSAFSELRISTSELDSETYYYSLRTKDGDLVSKEKVVVK